MRDAYDIEMWKSISDVSSQMMYYAYFCDLFTVQHTILYNIYFEPISVTVILIFYIYRLFVLFVIVVVLKGKIKHSFNLLTLLMIESC